MSRKIVIQIDKEGNVKVDAVGYVGDSCMKSQTLKKILETVEVDEMEKLFEDNFIENKEVNYEELI